MRDQSADLFERLWRAVVGYTRDRDIASDAVAEAVAQLLARGEAVRNPEAWLWRSSFKIADGMLAERRRDLQLEDARAALDGDIELIHLLDALAALSPTERRAMVMRYVGDYRTSEIGALLGKSPAAIRVHLHRARRKMREILDE